MLHKRHTLHIFRLKILRRFVSRAENNFDAIVFIIATKRKEILEKTVISEKCRIYFIFEEDLINSDEIKNVLYNFDEYITKDNNILIEDNYPLVQKRKSNLSFAIGAGCSRSSHISDWNTLSEALGYELLYSIVDTKESEYKNKIITDKLNTSIFSCMYKLFFNLLNSYFTHLTLTKCFKNSTI